MCVENCCDLNILVRIFFLKKSKKNHTKFPTAIKMRN